MFVGLMWDNSLEVSDCLELGCGVKQLTQNSGHTFSVNPVFNRGLW